MSMFEFSRTKDGFTVNARVTLITAVLVALVWLPNLLRTVWVQGGEVQGPSGTGAKWPGLAQALEKIDKLTAKAPSEGQQQELQGVGKEIIRGLASALSPTKDPRAELLALARKYERARAEQPSGYPRTIQMNDLVAQMRAYGEQAGNPESVITQLFDEGSDGSRIAALALIRNQPLPQYLPMIVDAISHPRSQFEQFQALLALEIVLPKLTRERAARQQRRRCDLPCRRTPGRYRPMRAGGVSLAGFCGTKLRMGTPSVVCLSSQVFVGAPGRIRKRPLQYPV